MPKESSQTTCPPVRSWPCSPMQVAPSQPEVTLKQIVSGLFPESRKEVVMYSPKIDEKLIPVLYRAAKAQGVPMTTLVNRLLTVALAQENLPYVPQPAFRVCEAPTEEVIPNAG